MKPAKLILWLLPALVVGSPPAPAADCNGNAVDDAADLGAVDPTLATAVLYPVDGQAVDLVDADLDGDGRIDLATTNWHGAASNP